MKFGLKLRVCLLLMLSIKTKAALHYDAQPKTQQYTAITSQQVNSDQPSHRACWYHTDWWQRNTCEQLANAQGRFINSLFTVYTLFNIYSRGNWNNGLAIFGVF